MDHRLKAEAATLSYNDRVISSDLNLDIKDGSFTVIVGPNACGKSTLLRALSRLLVPRSGQISLDGKAIQSLPVRDAARTIGLLPQSPLAPSGIRVSDLVARGRYPHQSFLRQWSEEDAIVVRDALEATGITALADRFVEELSGGQRQRVWIALALAQQTPILLLDEPTTYLDITHQLDVLDLLGRLNARGRTIVAVLHDLNQACRYATDLIMMRDGAILAQGAPGEIVVEAMVYQVFGLAARVVDDPETGTPMIIPRANR